MRIVSVKSRVRFSMITGLGLLLMALIAGGATAATLASDDTYRLPAGQVIEDNLYVTGGEIIIDGKIDGDLVAGGGYIEINGEVSGDVLAAGGGIVVNGPVAGDVRIFGGGLTLNGPIGGDLVSAGGGASVPGLANFPLDLNGRQIQQGTVLARTASVGKDALMAGGSGVIQGAIAGSLWAAMGAVQLDGTVGGDANLYSNQIVIGDGAQVGGTLFYTADEATAPVIPGGVAASVERVIQEAPAAAPPPTFGERLVGWTISVVRALAGLLLLGWALVQFLPHVARRTLEVMNSRALAAFGVGFLVVLVAVPVILLATVLAWLFWGFGSGLTVAFFLFGLIGVFWIVSQVLIGLWVGRRLLSHSGDMLAIVVGVLILLLVVRAVEWLPIAGAFVGWLLLLFSFAYAAGALILTLGGKDAPPSAAMTTTGPPL